LTAYALDYAAGPPAATAVHNAGYRGVIRYVGFPRRKCISKAEYLDHMAHGVAVAAVFEDLAGDALAGSSGGRRAAQLARGWCGQIGFPAGRPIYYACDIDLTSTGDFARALDYIEAVSKVEGPDRVGVYGEADLLVKAHAAGLARYFWLTGARGWSPGRDYPAAQLRQHVGYVQVGGVECDLNEIRATDWGQAPAPGIQPQPVVHPDVEDDMPTPDDVSKAVWSREMPWPAAFADLPHVDKAPSLADYLVGASVRSFRASADTAAIKRTLAALTSQLAAQTALMLHAFTQPGGLTAEQAHQIAQDAAAAAVDGITITVHTGEDTP
jgi:Domain of unknown function (DUF1906)